MKSSRSLRAFNARIDGWVIDALGDGATDFSGLLSRLPGVFPADAVSALRRLKQTNLSEGPRLRLARNADNTPVTRAETSPLPPPHPLDFEWRFTSASTAKLWTLIESETRPGDDILLFGMPTLALSAIRSPRDRTISFVGENNVITGRLSALNEAAALPISVQHYAPGSMTAASADAVVLDPPWYFDFIRPMMTAAAFLCRPSGVIVVGLPPIGARATAEQDQRRIRDLAQRLSLEELFSSPCALTYDMPFFEANALAAAGVFGVQSDWRRGDLAVFRKAVHQPRMIALPAIRRPNWHQASVGRMRLFIRNDQTDALGGPSLRCLVPGDILPSVSRRDPRRRRARVWTSGNRIFGTSRPDLVLAAAHELSAAAPSASLFPDAANRRDELERLKYTLLNLAGVEHDEERVGR